MRKGRRKRKGQEKSKGENDQIPIRMHGMQSSKVFRGKSMQSRINPLSSCPQRTFSSQRGHAGMWSGRENANGVHHVTTHVFGQSAVLTDGLQGQRMTHLMGRHAGLKTYGWEKVRGQHKSTERVCCHNSVSCHSVTSLKLF